ncbi:MAG TPA: hypothetical protein VGK73_16795 [Polyangiaceae bacterium]
MNLSDYEKKLLASTPGRVLTFLRAAATKVEIRAALFAAGYSTEEQATGWSLLEKASGYVPNIASVSDDGAARAALAEVDAWDEPGFRRIGAALERLHPEQHSFVFAGLETARGAGSLLAVSTLLDRLDALESAPERKNSRADDRDAIATLTARGITPAVRAHLRDLIRVAQTAEPPTFPVDSAVTNRDEALKTLGAWYRDWSETARAVIQRRDYLVMLGLAQRKTGKPEDDDGDLDTTEPTSPVAPTVSGTP